MTPDLESCVTIFNLRLPTEFVIKYNAKVF